MTERTHVEAAGAAAVGLCVAVSMPVVGALVVWWTARRSAMLPDRSEEPLGRSHRRETHSVFVSLLWGGLVGGLVYGVGLLLVGLALRSGGTLADLVSAADIRLGAEVFAWLFGIGVAVGSGSHGVMDCCSDRGCWFFWPFVRRRVFLIPRWLRTTTNEPFIGDTRVRRGARVLTGVFLLLAVLPQVLSVIEMIRAATH